MNEEVKPQEAQTEPTSTETKEQTLEDVYQEFKVEPQAPVQPTPTPQAQPQSAPEVSVSDPVLDPEGYKVWAKQNAAEAQQMKGALRAVAQHLQKYEQERAQAVEEADIKKAVGIVNSKFKAPDESFVEIAIAHRARTDPKFMAVWQNRGKNPAALQAALGALGTEYAKKYEFRTDPQLTENQRAMKEATQTKAVGAPPESVVDRLAKATGREFEAELDRIRQAGI